jgi:hypothetical protein
MSSKRNYFKIVYFLATFVFVFMSIWPMKMAVAEELVARSIGLSSSFPSENVFHTFNFTTVTPNTVGSVEFEYCSNSPLFDIPCVSPAGLNVSGAGIAVQNGLLGFTVSGVSSANRLVLTKAPVFEAPVAASYQFSNIINPSTPDSVNYVRITLYDSADGAGAIVDRGSVVFVIDDRFNVELYVPPYLTFCVGVTVALDCTSVAGFLADFGELNEFAPATATSQMSVATNDPTGYSIFVNGSTMTAGTNIIPALATQSASSVGVSQFGINLRANTSPAVGSNPTFGSSATGTPNANYNTPNQFRFINGDLVAGTNLPSGYTRYTASYLVNVSEDQAPGVYATTLTYTAVASF